MIKAFLGLIFFSDSLWAYQSSLNEYSKPLRWGNTSASISTSIPGEGLTSADVESSLSLSVNQWNSVNAFQLYTSGTSSNNELKFDENFSYGSGILAVTEVSYGASGVINSAKIFLNDRDFDFTSNPSVTSKIYLPTVLTHELGHFLGLSHSEVLDATMFYSFFSGQETITSDDAAGLRSKYKKSQFGKIYGHVKGGNQIGVLGAHVQAISTQTGDVISTLSDEKGFFEIAGLNFNDHYYLYTSPVKNINSLPSYFSNTQDNFCPGIYQGGVFSACGSDSEGIAQSIQLNSSTKEMNVGIVSINCSVKNQLDYRLEKVKPIAERERVILFNSVNSEETQRAYIGHINSNEVNPDNFQLIDKFLIDLSGIPSTYKAKLQLISKQFGNPLAYSLAIDGPLSSTITSSVTNPGAIDLSRWLQLSANTSQNIYEIDLSAKNISSLMPNLIPSTSLFTANSPWPYLLILSLWEQSPTGEWLPISTESLLSDNESCLDAPFTAGVKKSEFSNAIGNEDTSNMQAGATCGTIDPPDDGPSSSLLLTVFGLMVSSFMFSIFKKTKNFLS